MVNTKIGIASGLYVFMTLAINVYYWKVPSERPTMPEVYACKAPFAPAISCII